jgi:predicted porin
MRKILLGTTAVVGAALLGATAAQAQTAPTVRVGGYLQTTGAWVSDDLDSARGAPTGVNAQGRQSRQNFDFRNEVEIQVFVNGKAANGLAYGAVVEIQNDNVGGGSGSALDLDEAYVFVTSPTLGTVRFGEEDSAASIMAVRAPSITGFGADGAWDVGILGTANGTGGNPSILTGINDGNDSTKIVYLSPQFFGFDFGLSYGPNPGEGDRMFFGRAVDTLGAGGTAIAASATQRDATTLSNEISGSLRYRGSFSNVGIAAAFSAMRADAQSNSITGTPPNAGQALSGGRGFRDITAYTGGINLTAFGFTVGGEYTWGNYSGPSVGRAPLANNANGSNRDSSSHWLLGVTYVTGAISVGAYYGQGYQDNGIVNNIEVSDRTQTGWGIGAAYTVAPGLEVFLNYNNAQDKNVNITAQGGTLQNRNWEGVFFGTRLAF